MFCLMQLPIWGFFAIINQKEKTLMKKIVSAFKPNSSWGPNDPDTSNIVHLLLASFANFSLFQCKNIENSSQRGTCGDVATVT